MDEKECSKCLIIKPLDNFYKASDRKDGHRANCKDCHGKHMKSLAKNNGDHYLTRIAKRYIDKFPLRKKARNAVAYAIRVGNLIRPNRCESCEKKCRPQGHHDDYSKLLIVRWLCALCHGEWHTANGEGING